MKVLRAGLLGGLLLLVAAACTDSGERTGGSQADADDPRRKPNAVYTGDLDDLQEVGRLRVLLERQTETYLPRHGPARFVEQKIAERFATRMGMQAELVYVERFTDLFPALLEGKGDLIAANLTVTNERAARVAFTDPLSFARDTLVSAVGGAEPEDFVIQGRVAAREGTTLLAAAQSLAAQTEDLTVLPISPTVSNEAVLDALVAGEFELAVQDSNTVQTALTYRDDLQVIKSLSDARPLAWAVRKDSPRLLTAINAYLREYRLVGERERVYVADLEQIKQSGRLRMITRNNAATYFLWRGELFGFEYELARRFADELDLRLEVVVAPTHAAMIPMLLAGEGDFVASYLVPTPEREALGAAFSRPYHYASELLVGRADEPAVERLADLSGRAVVVRRSSAYWTHMQERISEEAVDITLKPAPAVMETQEIIERVASGEFDLTVADSHILDIEMTYRDDIQGLLAIGDKRPHAWAVHPDNTALLQAMNAYLKEAYRGLHYNLSYAKYFKNPRFVKHGVVELISPGHISPYDETVRKYAEREGFDWRVIVAQMFKESRFDPEAQSWMGAVGLMQVLPRTGKAYGFRDLKDPETNIRAGITHLAWVRERFPSRLPRDERLWFALAGYNAGHGHVRDAIRLARKLGLDPDQWFDNVEQAMLKLEEPRYARAARHGYVRGREPVHYVRDIRNRFQAYARLLSNQDAQ